MAQGFTPNTDVPAEEVNWLFGVLSDFVSYLDSWWNAPLVSSTLPQLRFKDAAGNGRWVIDHNGLPTGGAVSQFTEGWATIVTLGSPPLGWFGPASLSPQNPTANYNARFVELDAGEAAGITSAVWTAPLIWPTTPGMSLVLEFDFGLNSVATAGTSNATWYMGLTPGTAMPDGPCMFIKQSNSTIFTGTTTVPTAGNFPTDRYRIEIQGSASPYGAYQALFWINEVLVRTLTSESLSYGAGPWRIWIGCLTGSGLTGAIGYLGPVKLTWNRFTSGPNL
jgi:hypothetical protein